MVVSEAYLHHSTVILTCLLPKVKHAQIRRKVGLVNTAKQVEFARNQGEDYAFELIFLYAM